MFENFYINQQKEYEQQLLPTYTAESYVHMLGDSRRNLFYKNIIDSTKPDVVLDFGCGIPILSYYALLAGAKKVYAIDNNKILVPYLEKFKKKFSDRFEYFITDHNNLPDIKPNFVISEMLAPNMFHENIVDIYSKIISTYPKTKLQWLPSRWKINLALCNKNQIEKNVGPILGVTDEFNFLCNKWKTIKGAKHQKFMFPVKQEDFIFADTEWTQFPDFSENKWIFRFNNLQEMDVDLAYIKFTVEHNGFILDINTTQSTDHWGNQFISLEPRTIENDAAVCLSLDVDKKSIDADWI